MEKLDIAIKDFLINTGLENGVNQQKAPHLMIDM